MPYYSISLHGGSREERKGVRETFGGRESDYTGHDVVFYVERNYNIAKMRMNLEGVVPEGIDFTVKRIGKKEFEWRRHQKR
jgi:hypothetical protein